MLPKGDECCTNIPTAAKFVRSSSVAEVAACVELAEEFSMSRYVSLLTSIALCLARGVPGEEEKQRRPQPSVSELIATLEENAKEFTSAPVQERNDILLSMWRTLDALEKKGVDAAPAVPAIVKVLKTARDRRRASENKDKYFLSPGSQLEKACIRALEAIGPDAAPAAPLLIQILDEDELVRISSGLGSLSATYPASVALARIGPPAVKPLLAALHHRSERTRYHALWALQKMGSVAKDAVPTLRESLLRDDEYMVRQHAAWTIAEIGDFSDETVAALVAAVADEKHVVRCAACDALGKVRPVRADVVGALLAATGDDEVHVRVRAIRSLGNLGPAAVEAVPTLVKMLDSSDAYLYGHPGREAALRADAAEALGRIGPIAKMAMPALLRVIRQPRTIAGPLSDVRPEPAQSNAIQAVVAIDPTHPDLVDLFRAIIARDSRGSVMKTAVWALGRIGRPTASPAAPLLRDKLQQLAQLTPRLVPAPVADPFSTDPPSSEPEMELRDPLRAGTWEEDLLRCVAASLLRLEPGNDIAFQQVVTSLERNTSRGIYLFEDEEGTLLADAITGADAWKTPATRRMILEYVDRYLDRPPKGQIVSFDAPEPKAAQLMATLDPDGRLAAPILLRRLQRAHFNDHLREAMVKALGEMPSARRPALEEMLRAPEPRRRAEAVTALSGSPANLPLIVSALDDASARVRLAALQTLEKFGAKATSARAIVERLREDDLQAIRLATERTLCALRPD